MVSTRPQGGLPLLDSRGYRVFDPLAGPSAIRGSGTLSGRMASINKYPPLIDLEPPQANLSVRLTKTHDLEALRGLPPSTLSETIQFGAIWIFEKKKPQLRRLLRNRSNRSSCPSAPSPNSFNLRFVLNNTGAAVSPRRGCSSSTMRVRNFHERK